MGMVKNLIVYKRRRPINNINKVIMSLKDSWLMEISEISQDINQTSFKNKPNIIAWNRWLPFILQLKVVSGCKSLLRTSFSELFKSTILECHLKLEPNLSLSSYCEQTWFLSSTACNKVGSKDGEHERLCLSNALAFWHQNLMTRSYKSLGWTVLFHHKVMLWLKNELKMPEKYPLNNWN